MELANRMVVYALPVMVQALFKVPTPQTSTMLALLMPTASSMF